MHRMLKIRFALFLFVGSSVLLGSPHSAIAGGYILPRVGAYVPVDGGDVSYSVGITLGYSWTQYFATEIGYSRLIASGDGVDGDVAVGQGVLAYPGKWLTPYVSAGAGMIHTSFAGDDEVDPLFPIGAGVSLRPFGSFSIGLGVTYGIVSGGPDYIDPGVSIGLGF